jgi:SAM-dependent methyltransferase
VKTEHFEDPVAAYNRLAAHYPDLCRRREPYLRSVEPEVASRIPQGSRSLLDLGAGDGSRALRIAGELGIERVVLVEPSEEMAGNSADHAEVWPIRAEDLAQECLNVGTAAPGRPVEQCSTNSIQYARNRSPGLPLEVGGSPCSKAEKFDVITCLWNVLGHVSADKRVAVLSSVASLLAQNGKFFLDVNHRYNMRSYGILATSVRWLHDLFSRRESNGEVCAKWQLNDSTISTRGHVFTHNEIMRLARAAGLEWQERIVIDYENGSVRRFAFQGNLLYIFRRNSRIDSSSAPQTS